MKAKLADRLFDHAEQPHRVWIKDRWVRVQHVARKTELEQKVYTKGGGMGLSGVEDEELWRLQADDATPQRKMHPNARKTLNELAEEHEKLAIPPEGLHADDFHTLNKVRASVFRQVAKGFAVASEIAHRASEEVYARYTRAQFEDALYLAREAVSYAARIDREKIWKEEKAGGHK